MYKKQHKAPVTIIIGIKCTNGIVVSCDSQTTNTDGTVYRDAIKLHEVPFAGGASAIIAEAGNAQFSSRAIEVIKQRAIDKPISDYRAVAECAEDSIAELQQKIRGSFQGTSEELFRHWTDYGFELMAAYFFDGKPFIFTVDLAHGIARKRDPQYVAIGCGAQLADFLINRLDLSKANVSAGVWTSTYAVEEVKAFDGRCGGKTRIAVVRSIEGKSVVEIPSERARKEAEEEASAFAVESKKQWIKVAGDRITKVIRRKMAANR